MSSQCLRFKMPVGYQDHHDLNASFDPNRIVYREDPLPLIKNPNSSSLFKAASSWSGGSGGIYNIFALMGKTADGAVWFSSSLGLTPERITDITNFSHTIGIVKDWLIIPKISSFTMRKFCENFSKWITAARESLSRKRWVLIYDTLDITLDFLSFSLLFRASKVIKRASNIGFLALHSWNLRRGAAKYVYANDLIGVAANPLLKKVNPDGREVAPTQNDLNELNTYLTETRRAGLFKIVLSAANIAKDLFVFGSFFISILSLSSFPFWTLGTVVVVLRISKELYDASLSYCKVKRSD